MDITSDDMDVEAAAVSASGSGKPFQVLIQPLLQVLRDQLGPGELDAAARVCRTWASQLANDVVRCEMCLPGCYELLLCQLEQLAKRFRNVHNWHLWLPAGAQWSLINDLLWLLSRYKAEKLQLDGRLSWNTGSRAQLPELDNDVFPWMASMRSLQSLRLTHCTLASASGLVFVSFLSALHTLEFGLRVSSAEAWLEQGLDPWLSHLCKLQQVSCIELHLQGSPGRALVLPAQLPEQVQRLFAACPKLQRFALHLDIGWGVVRDFECVVYERTPEDADAAAGVVTVTQAAGNAAAAAILDVESAPAAEGSVKSGPSSLTAAAAGGVLGTGAPALGASSSQQAGLQKRGAAAAAAAAAAGAGAGQPQQQGIKGRPAHSSRGRHNPAAAAAGGAAARRDPFAKESLADKMYRYEREAMQDEMQDEMQDDMQDEWMQEMLQNWGEGDSAAAAAAGEQPAGPELDRQFRPHGRRGRDGMDGGHRGRLGVAWRRLVVQRSSISSSPRKQLTPDSTPGAAAEAEVPDAVGSEPATAAAADASGRPAPARLRRAAQGSRGVSSLPARLPQGAQTLGSFAAPRAGLRQGSGSAHGGSGNAQGSGPLPLSLLDRELGRTAAATAAAAAAAAAGAAAPPLGPVQLMSRELGGIAAPNSQLDAEDWMLVDPTNADVAIPAGAAGSPGAASDDATAMQVDNPLMGAPGADPAAGLAAPAAAAGAPPVLMGGTPMQADIAAAAAALAAAMPAPAATPAAPPPAAAAATSAPPPGPAGPADNTAARVMTRAGKAGKRRTYMAEFRGLGRHAGRNNSSDDNSDSEDLEDLLLSLHRNRAARPAAGPVTRQAAAAAAAAGADGVDGDAGPAALAPPAAAAGEAGPQPRQRVPPGLQALLATPSDMLAQQGMAALLPLQAAAAGGGAAEPPAAAAAVVPAGFIRRIHYNMVPVNKQGVMVSRLSLEGLAGHQVLQQRLLQQLSLSPALHLTSLELSFLQSAETAQGSGVFWQQLLQQMPLLRELRLDGMGTCETGFEVPHLWDCVGQLTGLTQLSYSRRTQGGNTANTVPEAPEGSAAALAAMLQPDLPPAPPAAATTDKLRLDLRLMQGLAQMDNLRDFVFIGDLRAASPYSSPLSAQPSASLAAAGGDPGIAQAAAGTLMDLGSLITVSRLNRCSGGGSGGSGGAGSGGGGAGSGGSGSGIGRSPIGYSGSGLGLARGDVLSMLQGLQGLQTLVLEQWPDHMPGAAAGGSAIYPSVSVVLDVAWLPTSLTSLKLAGMSLSCRGNRTYMEGRGAVYAAALLQERQRNTPDAWWLASEHAAAAAAAADVRGKRPMPPEQPSSRRAPYNPSMCTPDQQPVVLHKLTHLSLMHCFGTLQAIAGCFAHSTGVKRLELAHAFDCPTITLAAIAWMWPRITEAGLSDLSWGSSSRGALDDANPITQGAGSSSQQAGNSASATATAAARGSSAACPMSLPNLLDELVTVDLAAAWLWGGSSAAAAGSSSSSSSGAGSSSHATSSRLQQEVSSRAATGRITWADATGLAQLAAALPNLTKLKLQLPPGYNRDIVNRTKPAAQKAPMPSSSSGSSSPPPFLPADLLPLAAAPRLRELVVELPRQIGTFDGTAASIRQLKALHMLRLLDLKTTVEAPMSAAMQEYWRRARNRGVVGAEAGLAAANAAAAAAEAAGAAGAPGGGAAGLVAAAVAALAAAAGPAGNAGGAAAANPANAAAGNAGGGAAGPAFAPLPPMMPGIAAAAAAAGGAGAAANPGRHNPNALLLNLRRVPEPGIGRGPVGRPNMQGGCNAGLDIEREMQDFERRMGLYNEALDVHMRPLLDAAPPARGANASAASNAEQGQAADAGQAAEQQQQQQGAGRTGLVPAMAQGAQQPGLNAGAGSGAPGGGLGALRARMHATRARMQERLHIALNGPGMGAAENAAGAGAAAAGAPVPPPAPPPARAAARRAAAAAAAGADTDDDEEEESDEDDADLRPPQRYPVLLRDPRAPSGPAPFPRAGAHLVLPPWVPAAAAPLGQNAPAAAAAAANGAEAEAPAFAPGVAGAAAPAAAPGMAAGAAQPGAGAAAGGVGPDGAPLDDLVAMYIDDEWWEDISDVDSREAILRDIAAAAAADDAADAAGNGEGGAPVQPEGGEQEAMAGQDWMPGVAAAAAAGAGDAAGVAAAAGALNPPVFPPAAGGEGQAAAAGAGAVAGPGAAAAAGGGAGAGLPRRRFKPSELQAELRRDMPNTSVFISILRG